jgi:hypothetical protein
MKTGPKRGALRNLSRNALKLLALAMPIYASAQTAGATQTPEVNDVVSMFTQGHFSGDVRAFYYGAHNAFYKRALTRTPSTTAAGSSIKPRRCTGFRSA